MSHDTPSQAEDSDAQRLSAALAYVRRGWPIIPLHDVSMGFCSCGDTSEKHATTSAGKHPLAKAWGLGALVDEDIVRSVFAGRPGMNFGIKTGLHAGVWTLDVDPKNGGDLALQELVKEHGELPDTYTVRTGSGGRHLFWELPPDFTPTNSPGSLPAGLDVRGEGGFVVGAPSRSGIGPYEVLLDIPVIRAPEWLENLIRPRVPTEREHTEALAHWDHPAAAAHGDRLTRYAWAAMVAEVGKLADAVPGRRGSTAHAVACSLIELVNSPWSGISGEVASGHFMAAVQRAMTFGGAFDEREAWSAWSSAARKIGTRGREVPPMIGGGVLLGWNQLGGVPPFSPSASGPAMSGIPMSSEASGSRLTGDTGRLIGQIGPAESYVDLVSPVRQDVSPPQNGHDPVDALISTFLDGDGLAALPPPEWLIKDWLPSNGLIQTVGQPGHGKSFVTLDQAMCVALGRAWRGQRVQKARVAYLVAEGAPGMGQRYKAWCKRFNEGATVGNITFIPYPIQAGDNAAWELLIMACQRLAVGYVVIDTQARVTVGMEENSAKEMGMFVHQVERLRQATGATVNLVHHLNKSAGGARGSGAMLGAVHTEITVSKAEDQVTVKVTKQKDADHQPPITLRLVSETIGTRAVSGGLPAAGWSVGAVEEQLTAGVLVDVDAIDAKAWEDTDSKGRMLMVLRDIFPHRGATQAQACTEAQRRGLSRATAYRAWDALQGAGLISVVVVDDRPTSKYVATPVDQRSPS